MLYVLCLKKRQVAQTVFGATRSQFVFFYIRKSSQLGEIGIFDESTTNL